MLSGSFIIKLTLRGTYSTTLSQGGIFSYVIIRLIGVNPMNAYLRIDSYIATEKLIASYILQDSAIANISILKKTGSVI